MAKGGFSEWVNLESRFAKRSNSEHGALRFTFKKTFINYEHSHYGFMA